MKTSHITNALLVAAAMLGAPAHAADASASASITGFTLQLIDLDTADGIAPSIVFNDARNEVRSGGQDTQQYLEEYGSNSVTLPYGSASASLSDTELTSHSTVTSGAHGTQAFGSSADSTRYFTLSPSTGLLITATGHLDASGVDADHVEAGLYFSLSMKPALEGIEGLEYRTLNYRISEGSRDYRLSAYLATGTLAQSGNISLRTDAGTVLYAAPVPEPETWGMLLAGAVLVGGMARRRQRG